MGGGYRTTRCVIHCEPAELDPPRPVVHEGRGGAIDRVADVAPILDLDAATSELEIADQVIPQQPVLRPGSARLVGSSDTRVDEVGNGLEGLVGGHGLCPFTEGDAPTPKYLTEYLPTFRPCCTVPLVVTLINRKQLVLGRRPDLSPEVTTTGGALGPF